MRQALTLAAALLVAACGGNKGDQRVGQESGALSAPAVGEGGGAGGSVNGRGITDSNAARPAATSGTGAPDNSGVAANGNATTSGASGSGGSGATRADSAGAAGRPARP